LWVTSFYNLTIEMFFFFLRTDAGFSLNFTAHVYEVNLYSKCWGSLLITTMKLRTRCLCLYYWQVQLLPRRPDLLLGLPNYLSKYPRQFSWDWISPKIELTAEVKNTLSCTPVFNTSPWYGGQV
jgi:hypothetical protein